MSEQDSWKRKQDLESRICKGLLNVQMSDKGTNKNLLNEDQILFIGHQQNLKTSKVAYNFRVGH